MQVVVVPKGRELREEGPVISDHIQRQLRLVGGSQFKANGELAAAPEICLLHSYG
jgi:hypothetical protein